VHDRTREWAELTRFLHAGGPGATLGFVYGRRRQGKTFLLNRFVEAADGFMFTVSRPRCGGRLPHGKILSWST
jgi:AAA+ ATPase superfamily predicted ATPase